MKALIKNPIYKGIIFDNYIITSNAQVINRKRNKVVVPRMTPNGYVMYGLYINGKRYECLAHRLMLETFRPNPKAQQLQGHHINHDKTDNCLYNLVWATRSENMKARDLHYGK